MPSLSAHPSREHPRGSGDLTERYVHAVTRSLPEDQRDDVADELRGSIADRVEALVHDTPTLEEETAHRTALIELGDPDRLAAGYSGRRLQLIGPELYPSYVRVLRAVLSVAVPASALVVGVVDAFSDGSVGSVIGGALWTAFAVGVQVAFWVTLAYAVVERGAGGAETPSAIGAGWSPDDLPDLPGSRGSLSDTVASVVWLGLLGGALVWQQVRPPLTDGTERVPVLDPDLWSFWWPLVLVLLVAEMAFEVVRYRTASIRPGVNMLIGAAFAAPLVYLGATGQILNPAAVARIQEDWAGFDPDTVHTLVVVIAVAIWLWDSVEGWKRARGASAAG